MKPDFALTLSFDGIGLLMRSFPGWVRVGQTVALDVPDLAAALGDLRAQGLALAADGASTTGGAAGGATDPAFEDAARLTCKLVIPNDQIRYLSVETGDVPGFRRADLARAALDGQTPYPVADLAFDWSAQGEVAHIAAVARETLAEAESFAQMHGFDALSFVAIAPAGAFLGEPFFGTSSAAAALLEDGDAIVRDTSPIRVIGNAPPPAPKPQPEPQPEPQPRAEPQETAPAEVQSDPQPDAQPDTAPEVLPDAQPDSQPDAQIDTPTGLDTDLSTEAGADPAGMPAQEAQGNAPQDAPAAAAPPVSSGDIPDGAERAAKEPPAPSFSSVRQPRGDAPPRDSLSAAPRLSGVSRAQVGPTAASIPIPASQTDTPRAARGPLHLDVPQSASAQPQSETAAAAPPVAAPAAAAPAAPAAPDPDQETSEARFATRRSAAPRPLAVTPSADIAINAPRRLSIGLGGAALGETAASPAPAAAATRGKPKHLALILTGALVLFLAAIAAWAALFLDEDVAGLVGGQSGAEQAAEAGGLPQAPQSDLTDMEAEAEAALREARLPPADQPMAPRDAPQMIAPQTQSDAPAAAAPEASAAPPPVMSEAEAQTAYDASGIWQRPPAPISAPPTDSVDELYHTSIDPKVPVFDALALPDPDAALSDVLPGNRASPAAAGTRFALDARGLVRATPQGAITAEGVLVRAGKPAAVPPQLPRRLTEAPAPTEAETASLARLAAFRPRPRPDDLVEQSERSQLGGRSRLELAALRPKARPELPQQKQDEERSDTPTEQAVLISKRPEERPKDIAKIVARAAPAAAQTGARVQTAAVAAPRTVAPAIPSSASVAKQATVRGALNLRKINLIGISGKPSARNALVRLSNGSIKKVKVGDRIDGGRVLAIGERELRYSKGGRNVVLQMPKG
ncbi:hypothetical protein [Litorivita sp. NS0012-18]|uniref:hypothetical protein n=1 Tax=Litorivita sp. NS0012-18 TaxID=3127655 RepID=UPI003106D4F8